MELKEVKSYAKAYLNDQINQWKNFKEKTEDILISEEEIDNMINFYQSKLYELNNDN